MFEHIKARAAGVLAALKRKRLSYWISALLVFALTFAMSKMSYEFVRLDKVRAAYFQYLLDHGPRSPKPKFVRIILIDDDEYWNGDPAGRVPLNREYLARIVDGLVAANTPVIALDVDARLPNPGSMEIPSAYKQETCKLIAAIKKGAAAGSKFVLATPIAFDEKERYIRDSDIYQSNGLCERRNQPIPAQRSCDIDFVPQEKANITCGYIALPYDILAIPGPIELAGGDKLDSFALAVARAKDPALVDDALWQDGETVRYGSYISESKFDKYKARFSAAELLNSPGKINLQHAAVIVGANWSTYAVGRGPRIDLHPTPIGKMPGALLHANFAEAVLDERSVWAAPESVMEILEVMFSIVALVLLASIATPRGKFGALLSLLFALFLVQWGVLHGLGMFFDAFLPVFALGLHSLYDQALEGLHSLYGKLVGVHKKAGPQA
jgi:CHASE2 domain-containing sensor protein